MICTACGGKTDGLQGHTFTDGRQICRFCVRKIPAFIRESSGGPHPFRLWDFDAYMAYVSYQNFSYFNLLPLFCRTHRYGIFYLDAVHRLFYLTGDPSDFDSSGGLRKDNGEIFRLDETERCDFDFVPKKTRQGFRGKTVTGDVLLSVSLRDPEISFSVIVRADERLRAPAQDLSGRLSFPAGLRELQREIGPLRSGGKICI